jgi:hypothetical protein
VTYLGGPMRVVAPVTPSQPPTEADLVPGRAGGCPMHPEARNDRVVVGEEG